MSTYLLHYCLMFIKTWYILVLMESIAYQKSHVRELFNEISFLNLKMLCMWNLGTIYLLLTTLLVKCLKNATFGQIFVFLETLHCKVYMSKIQTKKKIVVCPFFLKITNIINIRFYHIANMSLVFSIINLVVGFWIHTCKYDSTNCPAEFFCHSFKLLLHTGMVYNYVLLLLVSIMYW